MFLHWSFLSKNISADIFFSLLRVFEALSFFVILSSSSPWLTRLSDSDSDSPITTFFYYSHYTIAGHTDSGTEARRVLLIKSMAPVFMIKTNLQVGDLTRRGMRLARSILSKTRHIWILIYNKLKMNTYWTETNAHWP